MAAIFSAFSIFQIGRTNGSLCSVDPSVHKTVKSVPRMLIFVIFPWGLDYAFELGEWEATQKVLVVKSTHFQQLDRDFACAGQ